MRIIIIEDERHTADDLSRTIKKNFPEANIQAMLKSVKEAVQYLKNNAHPDLLFCDIQLGDGLSFEIFAAVPLNSPVIFCTAYDEYALDAFKANGIDYILKPFTSATVKQAIEKWLNLIKPQSDPGNAYNSILNLLRNRAKPKISAVLVNYKDLILPINLNNVALFTIENEVVYLYTIDDKVYPVAKYLDELEQSAGSQFYRVNRQFLVNRKVIDGAAQYFNQRLLLNLNVKYKETITVSKDKRTAFLEWLSES